MIQPGPMTGVTNAYWLEQTEADLPTGNLWLSERENSRLESLRFGKRRTDWRLGRWTAKRALASCLNLPGDPPALQDVEIQAAPSGAPEVFLFSHRTDVRLSLSHRAGRALCVVRLSGASLGCDLELIESRDNSFVTDFFTANEQTLIEQGPADDRAAIATLLWSAKESALKALHVGLRLDTNRLHVSFPETVSWRGECSCGHESTRWSPLVVTCTSESVLRGWWRCVDDMVRTVVFDRVR